MLKKVAFNRIYLFIFSLLLLVATGCDMLPASVVPTNALVINEVVSSNTLSLSHEVLGSPDWIELYNTSNNTIDLTGYGLTDNIKKPYKWVFPVGTTIAPHSYLIVYASSAKRDAAEALCANFGLSRGGETLYLSDPYYNILQQLEIPALISDVSYARDAEGKYGYCASPTPGAANEDIVYSFDEVAAAGSASDALHITECMPNNESFLAMDGRAYPWAELYNSGTEPLLLSNYCLSDDVHDFTKWSMPDITIDAGQYIVVWFSGEEQTDGQLHAPFRLGKTDDYLRLSDKDGNLISMLRWPAGEVWADVSVLPDEKYSLQGTPGEANPEEGLMFRVDFGPMLDSSPVHINEILLHNEYSLRDETGVRSPWVELYNETSSPVSLSGYYLSDDVEKPFKWAFPADAVIDGESYLVVFLTGNDTAEGGYLHTSFRLSDSDDCLVLSCTEDMRQDKWELPEGLGKNVSIGNGTYGSYLYYTTPTPGAANTTHAFNEPLSSGYTDMNGIYISEVCAVNAAKSGRADWIELHNASNKEISLAGWRLSDDIDEPDKYTLESLTIPAGGYKVITASSSSKKGAMAPFGISPSGETLILSDGDGNIRDIFETGALRLGVTAGRLADNSERVFFEEATQGQANTANPVSGFAAEPVFSDMSLYHNESFQLTLTCATPGARIYYTTNGTVPNNGSTLYTGPITISANTPLQAVAYADGLLPSDVQAVTYLFETPHTLPVICLSVDPANWNALYSVTVRAARVEKEGHFSFYEADGTLGTAFGCGLRASGSSTLLARQKSITVYLRGAYGQSSTEYPFFTDSDVTKFSSLVLRNSGQDRTKARLRDSFFAKVVKGLNMEYVETRLTVVYVNGQYWGIYDLNENQNEDYMAAHYGIDSDKVDIIRRNTGVLAGSNSDNKRVRAYALSTDLSNDEKYAEYIQWVDPAYFMDYLIAQTYFANGDMFNQKYWRSQDYTVRWRPVYYDLDLALSSSSPTRNILHSYFNEVGVPSQDGSLTNMDFYVGLRKNQNWCEAFGERYVYVVLTQFDPDRIVPILDDMVEQLRPELPRHISRWNELKSMSSWESEVAALRKCLQERPNYALKYLQSEFGFTDAQMEEWKAKAQAAMD